MKRITKTMIFVPIFVLSLSGCTEIYKIGKLNMVSNRNVDNKSEYVLLRNYMGASKRELKKTKSTNLEAAIDETVKNTPGGEFLKNVKFYLVMRNGKRYYACEGDVWGLKNQKNYRGFQIGDAVQWTSLLTKKTGEIVDLNNAEECTIKVSDSGKFEKVKYDKLIKIK